MLLRLKLTVFLAASLLAATASADSIVYVVNGSPSGAGQFGTVNLATGAFTQISDMPEGSQGLVPWTNGTLLTLGFSGNFYSINPSTGIATLIGPTGFADCAAPPASPCGPHGSNSLAAVGGQIYATDFSNNLYKVNPTTGAATLIGPTGIPALPFTPATFNPDGTFNAYDEALFGANGNLYATFDAFILDFSTFTNTAVIDPNLYQIDPITGLATLIGPTDLNLGAATDVNGTVYAFNDATSQVVTLNLANGQTTFVTGFDPSAGIITGAAPVPEPASIMLTALGMAGLALSKVRLRSRPIRNP